MLLQCVVVAVYGSTYFFHTPGDAHFSHYIQLLRLHIAAVSERCWPVHGSSRKG